MDKNKKLADFLKKGKMRLFGGGISVKSLTAAGLITAASIVPQTVEARPPHYSKDMDRATNIVGIVGGGLQVVGGLLTIPKNAMDRAELEKAVARTVQQYQAQVARLNKEYAMYAGKGGITEQAIELQIGRFKSRNEAQIAYSKNKPELARAYEERAAAFTKQAIALDPILSKYVNGKNGIAPAEDGFYKEDDMRTRFVEIREKVDKERLNQMEKQAQAMRQQYNAQATRYAQAARQAGYNISSAWTNTLLGTGVVLGGSFNLYDINHGHRRPPMPPRGHFY